MSENFHFLEMSYRDQESNQIKPKNPAKDPSYKPERQTFGFIWTCFILVCTFGAIFNNIRAFHSQDYLLAFMDHFGNQLHNIQTEAQRVGDIYAVEAIEIGLELIEFFMEELRVRTFLIVSLLACIFDVYFFVMVLYYPDYCGGNPEFYKSWPLIVSLLLMGISGLVYHPVFMFFTIIGSLVLFAIKYLMYFGHDISGNCCCFCPCFKPWVYKKDYSTVNSNYYAPAPYPPQMGTQVHPQPYMPQGFPPQHQQMQYPLKN